MFHTGNSVPNRISINTDCSIFGDGHDPKHRGVIGFIRNFGAFQSGDMEIMNPINFFGVVYPVHIHVKIAGNNRSKIGLCNYLFYEQLIADAFLRYFREYALLRAMHYQYYRFGSKSFQLLQNPPGAGIIEITAMIRRGKYKCNLIVV